MQYVNRKKRVRTQSNGINMFHNIRIGTVGGNYNISKYTFDDEKIGVQRRKQILLNRRFSLPFSAHWDRKKRP